ncbi:MAG: hypothetical protein ACIAQZ_07660 [Sedimentisphaeraceae bacterium JB056]
MPEDKKFSEKVRAVVDSLDFIKIFSCFQMAINPNKLVIAFLVVVFLAFCGVSFDVLSSSVKGITLKDAKVYNNTVLEVFDEDQQKITELDVYKSMPEYMDKFVAGGSFGDQVGVFATMYDHLAKSLNILTVRLLKLDLVGVFEELGQVAITFDWALKYHTVYTLVYMLIFVVVMAVGGGAICRGAALEICKGNKPSILDNINYGRRKFTDFLCAPLAPIVLVLIFGSVISLVGFIGNLPWAGEIIMGILTIFSLLIGLVLVMILIGFAGGVHMMLPSIAIEGTDFNDAVSRGYCYAYSKPWLLGLYGFTGAVYGAICYLFVRLCAFTLLRVTYAFMAFGIFADSQSNAGIDKLRAVWPQPEFFNLTGKAIAVNIDWSEHFSHLLVSIAVLIISGVVSAFIISFYFSCCTVLYTLCRKAVDNDPIEKIEV